jgi:hypothetical protein
MVVMEVHRVNYILDNGAEGYIHFLNVAKWNWDGE